MSRILLRRAARLALAAALLAPMFACSSTVPSKVADAEHLELAYYGFREGNEASFILVSEDDPQYLDVASQPRSPDAPGIKRAPDALLRDLVEFAAERDFFAGAESLAGPADLADPNAKAMIVVRADGTPFSQVLRLPMEPDAIQTFSDVAAELSRTFRELPSLQYIRTNQDGMTWFEQQQRRIEESNQNARGGQR